MTVLRVSSYIDVYYGQWVTRDDGIIRSVRPDKFVKDYEIEAGHGENYKETKTRGSETVSLADLLISRRVASIALMFADIHCGDGDCLGEYARELMKGLEGNGLEWPEDADC